MMRITKKMFPETRPLMGLKRGKRGGKLWKMVFFFSNFFELLNLTYILCNTNCVTDLRIGPILGPVLGPELGPELGPLLELELGTGLELGALSWRRP